VMSNPAWQNIQGRSKKRIVFS